MAQHSGCGCGASSSSKSNGHHDHHRHSEHASLSHNDHEHSHVHDEEEEEDAEEDDDPFYAQQLEGLIAKDGDDITEELHAALSEIFDRFDRDKKGGWTLDGDLQRFAKKTQQGRRFGSSAIKAISRHYNLSEDRTMLTRNGFFQMCIFSFIFTNAATPRSLMQPR